MRLQTVKMHNFRQYKNVELVFPKTKNDIHIIKGKNGVGKTTFLNAINWCLYGDEPHAFDKNTSMPILNLTANDDDEVLVKISVVADDGAEFIFTRKQQNKKEEFAVDVKSKIGETKHYERDEALNRVDDFVPKVIREFFFFDGEQLDGYFLNNKGEHIKHNIFMLSHIDILQRMYTHLDNKYNSIRKEASNINSNVNEINNKLKEKEKSLEEEKEREKRVNDDIKKSSEEIKNLTKELEGIPDTRKLENKKQELESKVQACENKLKNIDIEKSKLIISNTPSLFTFNAIKSLYASIVEKEKNNELPYKVDEEIIQESLDEGVCKVCNRHLDESSKTFLRNSLDTYQLSTEQSKLLLNIKPTLKVFMSTLDNYQDNSKSLSNHYRDIDAELIDNQNKLDKLIKEYVGYDNDDKNKKFNLREELESSKNNDHMQLGIIKSHIENLKKDIDEYNKELSKAMENDDKLSILNRKKDLCLKAKKLVNDTKKEIMHRTKEEIELFTNSVFFDLVWKKKTYENIIIDDSYQLHLIHKKTKENTLGTASAAERELLTLSFTLGIHSISGFDAPLLIDTPLARISDDNRINFVKVLQEISEVKQMIIIVTPAEYSNDIAPILDNIESKHEITMNDDETISEIKEMK